jgi:hypothetical protein
MPETKTIHEFDVITTMANSDKLPLWNAAGAATKAITYANFITAATSSLVLSDYLKKNGSVALTANWDIGSGRRILGDGFRGRSSSGVSIEDDGGNYGIFIEDGGKVSVGGSTAPVSVMQVVAAGGSGGATAPILTVRNTTNPAFDASLQNCGALDFYGNTSGGVGRVRARVGVENANTSWGTSDLVVSVDVAATLTKVMRFAGVDGTLLLGNAAAAPALTSSATGIDVTGSTLRLRTSRTPASGTATGNAGEICWDASFLYICTATNVWERVAIATW